LNDLLIRLFFAVLPSEPVRPAIAGLSRTLRRAHHLRGRPIADDRLHVTLAPLFDPYRSPRDTILRAKMLGAGICYPRFPLSFQWSEGFRHRDAQYPLVLRGSDGVQPLLGFQQEIQAQMRRAGFVRTPGFTPHMTLLWTDRCVEAYPIAPVGWTVRDFALVLSLVGQSRHIHLAHWQLQ
jgi:2'-5' RNA ligase